MTTQIAEMNTRLNARLTVTRENGDYATFYRNAYGRVSVDSKIEGKVNSDTHRTEEEAQEFLDLLLSEGFTVSNRFIGYHESLPIRNGDIVTIKKGTIVKIMGKEPKPAGKTYKVKVHHVCCGSNGFHHHGEAVEPRNPKIIWPGAGGYWSEVDINDVPEATQE